MALAREAIADESDHAGAGRHNKLLADSSALGWINCGLEAIEIDAVVNCNCFLRRQTEFTNQVVADEILHRDHALQAIRRNGAHLLQVINDVLDLSKIEAGRVQLELIRHSPWQLLLEVVSTVRLHAEEKGISLEIQPMGRLPAAAVMDPTRIRQILMNLVSNAIKFSEPGGCVTLRVLVHCGQTYAAARTAVKPAEWAADGEAQLKSCINEKVALICIQEVAYEHIN